MKTTSLLLLLVLGILNTIGCSQDEKPTAEQIEPALRTYLVMEKARTCGGTVSVDRVAINKIGDFESKLDGYPVYATFAVVCVDGSNSSSWVSDDTSTANFTTVVRKKMSGEFECFMPELVQQRQNALQRQADGVDPNLLKTDAPKPITAPR